MNKVLDILKGFSFWQKTNIKESRVLIAFHHPRSITWLFTVWVGRERFGSKFKLACHNGNFLIVFFGYYLSLDTQKQMWREYE